MMVFLAVLLIFSSKTSKFRHSVTKKRQLLEDFVPQTPYRGFARGLHWGTSVPRPPEPLFSHILNTPLVVVVVVVVVIFVHYLIYLYECVL